MVHWCNSLDQQVSSVRRGRHDVLHSHLIVPSFGCTRAERYASFHWLSLSKDRWEGRFAVAWETVVVLRVEAVDDVVQCTVEDWVNEKQLAVQPYVNERVYRCSPVQWWTASSTPWPQSLLLWQSDVGHAMDNWLHPNDHRNHPSLEWHGIVFISLLLFESMKNRSLFLTIANPGFVNTIQIFTKICAVVRIAPPMAAEPLVRSIGTERIAIATLRPGVAPRLIGGETQTIVTSECRRTRFGRTTEFIVTANTIPDT